MRLRRFKLLISFILMIIIACAYVTLKDFDFNKLLKHGTKQTTTKQVASNAKLSDLGYPEWTYEKYPDYYAENGSAIVDESKFPEKGNINYTGKDSLGRTLAVYGTITYKMVEKSAKEKRPEFKPNDTPSGWNKNKKVTVETSTGLYDDGWFWNRSHLIADRLGGEATSNNAITGTRMQNVGNRSNTGGMIYIEEMATNYLKENRNKFLYYSAEPIYNKDELIPRYVIVNTKSEDGILDKQVITFNYQKGFTINYNDGTFTKDE